MQQLRCKPDPIMETRYPFYRQLDYTDCGLTCLKMVAAHYGKIYSLDYLRDGFRLTVGMTELSQAAEKIGLRTLKARLTYRQLTEESPLPCILSWNQTHFAVLYGLQKSRWRRWLTNDNKGHTDRLLIGDPGHTLSDVDQNTFLTSWAGGPEGRGTCLLLDPTPEFEQHGEPTSAKMKSASAAPSWLQGSTETFLAERPQYDYIYNTLL